LGLEKVKLLILGEIYFLKFCEPKFRGCPNGTEVDEKGEEMRQSGSAAG
jgi:hypothetical protein